MATEQDVHIAIDRLGQKALRITEERNRLLKAGHLALKALIAAEHGMGCGSYREEIIALDKAIAFAEGRSDDK